ncbi:P-loop containing nucleoside triphosphate hydrolase protein [Parathielavia hyrcaniae]|uniref:P-loop containing nucleoside triphosphate hydrolase protein n=1 Tax=Parathielavia hyrcaniae TaxID=113614 RepID=A0AAN6PUT0_9PEZI|nr:P-loop containing nucleoside triphosphate hydrolase protein [Parathielavia hyrcaniae]
MMLASCKLEENPQTGELSYSVVASLISHDGEDFGWGKTAVKLPYFEGKMKIVDLPVFPLDCHPQQESIRIDLANRGRRFVSLLQEPVCAWYGATAVCSTRGGENKFLTAKRVMVDPVAWFIHNYSEDPLRSPYVPSKKAVALHSVRDEVLLFCNHRALGFSFEEKRWGAFAVSRLGEPRWDAAAFSKVILPQDQLLLIRDLVLSHRLRPEADTKKEDDGNDDDDIIKDKGQGLVGLLSGNPGVGKTLNVEAVSEVTERPLYAVSAGELGTAVDEVDKRLGIVLDITRRWRCVLLIYEADVFLHKRGDDVSLERNAVVSLFLRRLEYFRGVAILTTNRDFDIDVAFMSRIHFKFHHKDLDPHTLFCIWKNRLAKELKAPEAKISETDLERLANQYHTLSGREIKNAAFCAKSISRIRMVPLDLQLIGQIIQNFGFLPRGRQLHAQGRRFDDSKGPGTIITYWSVLGRRRFESKVADWVPTGWFCHTMVDTGRQVQFYIDVSAASDSIRTNQDVKTTTGSLRGACTHMFTTHLHYRVPTRE